MTNPDDNHVYMNEKELKRLKSLYNRAVKEKKSQFKFQGYDMLTSFAKYYIEYIETIVMKGRM